MDGVQNRAGDQRAVQNARTDSQTNENNGSMYRRPPRIVGLVEMTEYLSVPRAVTDFTITDELWYFVKEQNDARQRPVQPVEQLRAKTTRATQQKT